MHSGKQKIVARIAPSPTGLLHVGTARTALFNWLFIAHAKKSGADAQFLLRIEDTDRERSKKEFEENIFDGLKWLGLDWDGEAARQSERGHIYRKYLTQLLADGKAEMVKEEAPGEGKRGEVIRLKNPGTSITFHDIVRGDITFDTKELGDFVIAKSLDEPLYHFAVVVDDHEMGVTHVIRGEDHISNTPRQILIQEAIGASRPVYCHLPLILAPDRSKLSKRHGAVALTEYRDRGYLVDALFNYLTLLGWNPGNDLDREPMTRERITELFSLERVQKSGGVFDITKLNSLNDQHAKLLGLSGFKSRIFRPEHKEPLQFVANWDSFGQYVVSGLPGTTVAYIKGLEDPQAFKMYKQKPSYGPEKLLWKNEPSKEKTRERLSHAHELLLACAEPWAPEGLKNTLWAYAEKEGKGEVLWPLRYALSGEERSPDPFQLASDLGKKETLKRIESAIQLLS